MFNPLHIFEVQFLQAFINKGVVAFVKQSYQRGRQALDPAAPKGYVLIHFEKLLAAQQYYDVLKDDPGREIFFTDRPGDMIRIKELISNTPVFMMLKIKDAEIKARKVLDKKLKAFIEYKLNWHPSRQDEVLFSLDVQFGEVYAKLKFRSKEIKVKLAEIEEAKYVL